QVEARDDRAGDPRRDPPPIRGRRASGRRAGLAAGAAVGGDRAALAARAGAGSRAAHLSNPLAHPPVSPHMRHIAALLLLATAVSARADALADLKRTLATLRGASAIAATYESRQTNKARGRFFNQNLNLHSVADVQAGAGGVTVTLSRATLDRLRAQRTAGRRDDEDGTEQSGDVAAGR